MTCYRCERDERSKNVIQPSLLDLYPGDHDDDCPNRPKPQYHATWAEIKAEREAARCKCTDCVEAHELLIKKIDRRMKWRQWIWNVTRIDIG